MHRHGDVQRTSASQFLGSRFRTGLAREASLPIRAVVFFFLARTTLFGVSVGCFVFACWLLSMRLFLRNFLFAVVH